ncbi:hypothetical protein O181_071660 [Austropuccinia psidii MF-1]|uniref:Uncharacterized protein n=1 Tax=Austropuccinia psidii MF-1 TaxID=1389203 RepID=A0A9Q3EYX6_9BASI|nr:hypothetical protein [Austropuccinia psidii MF-1]
MPVTPSEPKGSKGKGKRHSESLITAKNWRPIASQTSRKPQSSASIQGKHTLITCTGKIKIINPAVTSKGKFLKAVYNKFVQGTVKGTSQRTEKDCPEPEDQEEDTLDTVVHGKTLREFIPTLPFTFQFNKNLKPEDWKDMEQVLQLHQLLKDLFQWSMDNKRFNLASHQEELGASCQKICLKEIDFKELMVITKYWNSISNFILLEERETRIRENQANIQALEKKLTQTGHTQIPSGSQGVGQASSPVATHHSGTKRSRAKSHHSSQFQVGSRDTRIQGQKHNLFQPKAERVRPYDPEVVGIGERSTQGPAVGVHPSRISSPIHRNIAPTQTEDNVAIPEHKLNSDKLWLPLSQFEVQTKELLDDFKSLNEMLQKKLSQVFEEKHNFKRDRYCLDQEINKLFNVYLNLKPQPEGHVLENP